MARPLPIWKRALFAAVVLVGFLALVEGALTIAPWVMRRAHGRVRTGDDRSPVMVYAVGDSVTYGLGLELRHSYPWQLADGLVAAGRQDVSVMMVARPGAIGRRMDQELLPELESLAPGRRPLVYVMLGHNDFFSWDPDATLGAFDGIDAPEDPRTGGRLRLLRLFDWFHGAVEAATPNLRMGDVSIGAFQTALAQSTQAVRARGGALVLMTYVVPPPPPQGLPPSTAEVLTQTHAGQLKINAVIRDLAAREGVGLLDLEARIDTGAEWNTTWWLDNIHLSRAGLARVAEEVQGHLMASAQLPPPG